MNIYDEFHRQKYEILANGMEVDKIFISENLLRAFITTHIFHQTRTQKDTPNTLFAVPFFRIQEDNIFVVAPKL